jgi:P-type Cu+ transporter
VQISVVSQSVTVHHSKDLSEEAIKAAIDDVGFDLVSTPDEDGPPFLAVSSLSRRGSFLLRKREKHAAQCHLCQQGDTHEHSDDADRSQEDNEDEKKLRFSETDDNCHDPWQNAGTYPASLQPNIVGAVPSADEAHEDGPWHLTLSVGGMTCASCSNTITHMVSQIPGVSDVVVNLLGNSASATLKRQDLVASVLETIDDCGFEAEVMAVEPVKTSNSAEQSEPGPRSITLRVDGMFCRCADSRVAEWR